VPTKLPYYLEMGRRLQPLSAAPKVWNYLKYRGLPREARASVRRYTPQIASLMLTKRCNLACEYCNVGNLINQKGARWRETEATLAKVQRLFSNPLFGNCLLVDLLGGEPLLVDELEEIVAYLVKRGHIVNMATNGLGLIERIGGLFRAGISRINVSLYDTNLHLIERDFPTINHTFPVHTSIVLLRSDVLHRPDELLATVRGVRASGCKSLRFWIYRPMGIAPKPQEIIDDALPAYIEFKRRLEAELPGFCLWPKAIRKGPVAKRCPQLWQRISCDANGALGICCGTDKFLQGPHSNLFDGPPDTVFNHPTLLAMREQLLSPHDEPPRMCQTCNLLGERGW
jgi:Radical SAM superfamily